MPSRDPEEGPAAFLHTREQFNTAVVEQVSIKEQMYSPCIVYPCCSKDFQACAVPVRMDCALDPIPTGVAPMSVAPQDAPPPLFLLSPRSSGPKAKISARKRNGKEV